MKKFILVALTLTLFSNVYAAESCGATLGDADKVEGKLVNEDGIKEDGSNASAGGDVVR